MAVCWRCPLCGETSCESDANVIGRPLACDHCERPFPPARTLCTVCESPDPWRRRDSLHFVCLECGNAQTLHARVVTSP